jgi:hypothetical protein
VVRSKAEWQVQGMLEQEALPFANLGLAAVPDPISLSNARFALRSPKLTSYIAWR